MEEESEAENNNEIENQLEKKLNIIEKKVLDYLKVKLEINITGKEVSLNLSNKNIGNNELNLITSIPFDNLEEINLSQNSISDIYILKNFNLKKIKSIDLSLNNINNLKGNRRLDLSFNCINNIGNDKIKKYINKPINSLEKSIPINLNSNLIEKDIEELKSILIDNEETFLANNENNIKKELSNKINKLEKKILEYMNCKLNVNLTGKELKIDLNNKNIDNIDLNLLSGVEFKNLQELNLSHNEISDIEPIKNFKNIKILDLSYNKINNIDKLKIISEYNNKIEKLYLNNNNIKNVDALKGDIFPYIIEINLDNNCIIKKELEEIKLIVNEKKKKYLQLYIK